MYARTNKESAQQIADSFCPVLLKNKKVSSVHPLFPHLHFALPPSSPPSLLTRALCSVQNEDKGRNKKPYEPVKESAWDDPSSDPSKSYAICLCASYAVPKDTAVANKLSAYARAMSGPALT
eukprot:3470701-Rhodomonas_salina.2